MNAESAEVDRFGRRKYFVNSLTATIENGFLVRAWGVQRDITERLASERALRELELRAHGRAVSPGAALRGIARGDVDTSERVRAGGDPLLAKDARRRRRSF